MKTVRRTLICFVVLLLLIAAGGAGCAYWLWGQQDAILKEQVQTQLKKILDDWDIRVGEVRFDWDRRVFISDLQIFLPGEQEPFLTTPEVEVVLDRGLLVSQQEVVVQRILATEPVVHVQREADGSWNWQRLPPLKKTKRSLPEWVVQKATLHLKWMHNPQDPPLHLTVEKSDVHLIPSGKRAFHIDARTQLAEAGLLRVSGQFNVDAKTWTVHGEMNDIIAGHSLLKLVEQSSPDFKRKLNEVETQLAQIREPELRPHPGMLPVQTVTQQQVTAPMESSTLSIGGTVGIQFRLSKWKRDGELEYQVLADVRQGQIAHACLPFPLRNIQGKLYWDNHRLQISDFLATNGITEIRLNGQFEEVQGVKPGSLALNIQKLMLDERLRLCLPEKWKQFYELFGVTGEIDLTGKFHFDGQGGWKPEGLALNARNCHVQYGLFPYPVHSVQGNMIQQGEILNCQFQGLAGQTPVSLAGQVLAPGPKAGLEFAIQTGIVSIDNTLIRSVPDQGQEVLESLNLEGSGKAICRIYRPVGTDPVHLNLQVECSGCSLEYKGFPYRLSELSGKVTFSTEDNRWTFSNLVATHDNAALTGSGWFQGKDERSPGQLHLALNVGNAVLDQQLYLALPRDMQRIWGDLSPTGKLELGVEVDWQPNQPLALKLPRATVSEGSLLLREFPWPLERVEAEFTFEDQTVNLVNLQGYHEDTLVRLKGFFQFAATGDWRLRLTELLADDLTPDRTFRRALPESLRTSIDQMNPRGNPLSLSGMLELRGTNRPEDPVTAAWDLETVFSGVDLSLGVETKAVYGTMTCRGTWDGQQVQLRGGLNFDSLEMMDYQIAEVQGPYQLVGTQLIVGSSRILTQNFQDQPDQQVVPIEERVSGKAIGGIVTIDAAAVLADKPAYRVKLTLTNGKLEEYARLYVPGVSNLQGVTNGWVDLHGRGPEKSQMAGRGQIQISPAAIYELPVVLQIFQALRAPGLNSTAFRYAFADFTIVREQFLFHMIDMVGDTISLRGQGTAKFDGRLALNFYSMFSQNQTGIPFLSQLVAQSSTGWVGVEIRGKADSPTARIRAVPVLDDALRRFLGAFTPNNANWAAPRLAAPPLFPMPNQPLRQ